MEINWIETLIGFGFSVLASTMVMVVAYLWKIRDLLEKSNFKNQKHAEKQIIEDIKRSSTLRVYTMCGSTFSNVDEKNGSEIARKVFFDKDLKQKYLVSCKNNSQNIEKRQTELPQKKGDRTLQEKIETSIENFKNVINFNKNNREIRYHKDKVGFRLIICDDCLYLSHQEKGKYGKDTKIQRITSGTPAYINFSVFFDNLWKEHEHTSLL